MSKEREEELDLRLKAAEFDTGYFAKLYAFDVSELRVERKTVYDNLTNTQERCSQLLLSQRAATTFLLGKEDDNDPRDCVLVARQYVTSPYPEVHQWGVFVVDFRRGPQIDDTTPKGKQRRQFDTQQDALTYGWTLLKEIRATQ